MSAGPGLFEAFGVELEYMIVDRVSLDVRPLSDEILHAVAGAYESEVEVGDLAWSNELVMHVVELKTNGPRRNLAGLGDLFHRDLGRIGGILVPHGARLMPTAMHPWMDPETETRLWPHEHNPVYEAFDRIFDCRGHGWANLQSIHINLPFRGDEEFGRLHAAIRMVLPILPALAASSPFVDGRRSGTMDTRLDFYRRNCSRVPSVTGDVIPERVFTRDAYEALLARLYRDIAPLDPDRILQHEWLNARGAIARFDRDTIEIRLLDIQECPRADLAIVATVVELVRALVDERWSSWEDQKQWSERRLGAILDQTIRDSGDAEISDTGYLKAMGMPGTVPLRAVDVWRRLAAAIRDEIDPEHAAALDVVLGQGSLARRMARAWNGERASLAGLYRSLCACLDENRMFHPHHRDDV